jgi:hypothetical protein
VQNEIIIKVQNKFFSICGSYIFEECPLLAILIPSFMCCKKYIKGLKRRRGLCLSDVSVVWYLLGNEKDDEQLFRWSRPLLTRHTSQTRRTIQKIDNGHSSDQNRGQDQNTSMVRPRLQVKSG